MTEESLTLVEVDALIKVLGGVEAVRMILQRSTAQPSVQPEKAPQILEVKPKPISVVLELCGISANKEASGFIVRHALERLQEVLTNNKQKEVFLPKKFFIDKFEELKPDFSLGRLRNTFTPRQSIGLRQLQAKIAEYGYELRFERKGVVLQKTK